MALISVGACSGCSLPLRHMGFISLDSTFCRAEGQSHPTHSSDRQSRAGQHHVLLSDFTVAVWRTPTMGGAVLYLCSHSLICICNLSREALSPTVSAQGSPVQPLPRATQIKSWLLFISSLCPKHQTAADWGYAAKTQNRERFKTCF